jgi:flagellar hook-length control protein FliK
MEVKNNPMMDQLLVNTAAQTSAGQNAKAAQDADRPDFDSMVNQKRAGKDEPKVQKPAAKPDEKPEAAQAEETPVSGEQLAAVAAMLFQPQPEIRPMQETVVTATPTAAVETVREVDAEAPVAQLETPAAQETAALPVAEETAATAQTPQQTEAKPGAEPESETKPADTAAPVETKPEARTETPAERPVVRTQNAPRQEQDAPRAEKTLNAPRIAKDETHTAEETDGDDTQAAQAAPLFERVDAPVVKVAEAPRPVPLEAQDGAEQLGREIDGILVNNADANRIEVTLTPDSLGKLTVEITRGEHGVLNIVLHPSTERAASLLERNAGNLQNALASNGRSEVQVQVRPAEEPQQQFLNPDGQNEQQRQQQQQQGRRHEQRSAQDFLQQLRLGLVDVDDEQ